MHKVVIVSIPSLALGDDYLSRTDLAAMESRWLMHALRLRDPGARVAVVTSGPVPAAHAEHVLGLLPDPAGAARRLRLFSLDDPTPRPLAAKLLERGDVLAELRAFAAGAQDGWIAPFAVGDDDLAVGRALGLPVCGVHPRFAHHGTKSGSRRVFRRAGVAHAIGCDGVRDAAGILTAAASIAARRPRASAIVVKHDVGVAGAGNVVLPLSTLRRGVRALPPQFLAGLAAGGVVEELVGNGRAPSPSAQALIGDDGRVRVLATHDQVLGGPSGQAYVGCRIPADARHARSVAAATERIGRVLAADGARGRFGVDFVVAGGPWALEVNLREGATTHPLVVLAQLCGERAAERCLFGTDALASPAWTALDAAGVVAAADAAGVTWDAATATGVVFTILAGVERSGRIGIVCIAATRNATDALVARLRAALDAAAAGVVAGAERAGTA